MEEKEQKIIDSAALVFMQYGVKSVNMDDMARHLGISKKTLYQYVQDKDELVRKTIEAFCFKEDLQVRSICKQGLNAIDESLEIMKWVLSVLRTVHPSITYDMQKYHPEAYKMMVDNRHRAVYDCMMLNMKKGQREGNYRKDFNAEAIAKFYIARIDLIFDQQLFPQQEWKLPDVYLELFKYHIRGIASSQGLENLKEKLKNVKY